MFTGIIESIGHIEEITQEGENRSFIIRSSIAGELKIDQSVAHNGVCLTIEYADKQSFKTTAVKETLDVTNLATLRLGDQLNLERCLRVSDRLDGHFVQGHVDTVATCTAISEAGGSWYFTFEHPEEFDPLVVSKGSITVNGISLTVIKPGIGQFSVAIIPYTFENTNLKFLQLGDLVNVEFDILGKYVMKQKKRPAK